MTELEKFIKNAKEEMCKEDKDICIPFLKAIEMLELVKGVLEYYNGLVATDTICTSHRTFIKLEELAKEFNG